MQTCWQEVRRGCCGLHVVGGGGRGFEQITQGEEFPREKTDAGGITHSSPHSTAYAAGVNAVIGKPPLTVRFNEHEDEGGV